MRLPEIRFLLLAIVKYYNVKKFVKGFSCLRANENKVSRNNR